MDAYKSLLELRNKAAQAAKAEAAKGFVTDPGAAKLVPVAESSSKTSPQVSRSNSESRSGLTESSFRDKLGGSGKSFVWDFILLFFFSFALGPPEIRSDEVTLLQELGAGAYGKVYLGKCREQQVAVKVLHKQAMDAKVMEAHREEVRLVHLNCAFSVLISFF